MAASVAVIFEVESLGAFVKLEPNAETDHIINRRIVPRRLKAILEQRCPPCAEIDLAEESARIFFVQASLFQL